MTDLLARRRVSRVLPVLLAAALTFPGATGPAGGDRGAAGRDWTAKIDPFLRRLALGTVATQGRFARAVPPGSEEAARALPTFLQVSRAGPPVVLVKAALGGEVLDAPGAWEALAAALADLGVEARGRVGSILALRLPARAIEAVARRPEILWLKAAHGYRLLNEISTASAQVASDQANASFDRGAGVIVAVIDTGIQWTDRDFRRTDGTTRVLGIWDQTLSDPLHPPPAGFAFGAYYSRADIDAALAANGSLLTADGHGHGTHVAGTAAGNGLETGNGVAAGTFAGVAPEADLLIVRVFDGTGTFCGDCDLTAAVEFIGRTAAALGRPWVGNMSLGTDLGAHDGSDPDERTIDAAVGPGTRGAQMAIAAGNSGGRDRTPRPMHWEGPLPLAGASITNTFSQSSGAKSGSENDHIWIDLWYGGADRITVQVVTPGSIVVGAARGVDTGIVCTADGAIEVDATNAPDPANGDNEVFVQIWDSASCTPVVPPRMGTWTIRITTDAVASPAPYFNLWNEADVGGLSFVPLAVSNLGRSVGIPATARFAITAGSYADKDRWINSGGSQTVATLTTTSGVGSLSGFSSLGPTRDGRIKPDVAAPGEYIGSSLAGSIQTAVGPAFTERDGVHGDIRGTSMATPHVAGTAALLFGVNADLQGVEAKAAILASARSDAFTIAPGPLPNAYYGYGKLRALEAASQAATIVTDLGAASGSAFSGSDSPLVDSYNVYRGTIPGLSATDYGACLQTGLASPAFTDATAPPAGQAFFYLVTGVRGGVEGILGVDGAGRLRPNNSPCQ